MLYILFSLFEIAFATVIILEVKNENKLIDFEDKIIKRIRKAIRKRRCSQQPKLISPDNRLCQVRKSA